MRDINEGEEDGGTWSKEVRKRRIWGDKRKRGFLEHSEGDLGDLGQLLVELAELEEAPVEVEVIGGGREEGG